MDGGTFAQIAVPLAAAAASAYSPYVARGIGPALGVFGAMQRSGQNKLENQIYQQRIDEGQNAQDERAKAQAASDQAGQAISHAVDVGTPIPQSGNSFASAMGVDSPHPPVGTNEYPAGALSLDPTQAALVKGMAQVDPTKAYSVAAQLGQKDNSPDLNEIGGFARNLPPGVKITGKTKQGPSFEVTAEKDPIAVLLDENAGAYQKAQAAKIFAAEHPEAQTELAVWQKQNPNAPIANFWAGKAKVEAQYRQPTEYTDFRNSPEEQGKSGVQIATDFTQSKQRMTPEDVHTYAEGVVSGIYPPIANRGLGGQWGAIVSDIGKNHPDFNMSKAAQDFQATSVFLANQQTQGAPMLRSIASATDALANVKKLYQDWKATGLPNGFRTWNAAALQAAVQLPGPAGVAAQKLKTQIADAVPTLATVYGGGSHQTDKSLDLAKEQLSANWNEDQLNGAIDTALDNLRYRQNAITSVAPVGVGNTYYQPPAQPAAAAPTASSDPIARAPQGMKDGPTQYRGKPAVVRNGLVYAQ